MPKKLILILIYTTFAISAFSFDKNTVAILEKKEKISKDYFVKLKNEIRLDMNEAINSRIDFKKDLNPQVLQMITEKYILWQEGIRLGYHRKDKFKSRYMAALRSYFVDYVVEKSLKPKEDFRKTNFKETLAKLQALLLEKFQVKFYLINSEYKEIFNIARSAPALEFGKELPDAEYTPYAKFQRGEAEKVKVIEYRDPYSGEKQIKNFAEILEGFSEVDFYTFKNADFRNRIIILQKYITGILIPVEYKNISKDDPNREEYLKRIEENSMARFYMAIRGTEPNSRYIFGEEELDLEEVTITDDMVKKFYEKNKSSFQRPAEAEAYLLRLAPAEVDEGDEFIERLKSLEEPYHLLQADLRKKNTEQKNLEKKIAAIKDKVEKTKQQNLLAAMGKEIAALEKKSAELADQVAENKLKMFKDKIQEVNGRDSRKNNQVKLSEFLGRVNYDRSKEQSRYEKFIFMMSPHPFKGDQSILFASGEGDYVILYVMGYKRNPSRLEDPMVQLRIRDMLAHQLRVEKVKKFVSDRMKVVLPQSAINTKLLEQLK